MSEDEDSLQQERGVNQQYMFELQKRIDQDAGIARQITATPRNAQFHSHSGSKSRGPLIEPFFGRVALSTADPDLGHGFYIGSYRLDEGDLQVVSFAAPMARLFYLGRKADVDIANLLGGRRTFERSTKDLVNFEDEMERGMHTALFAPGGTKEAAIAPAPRPVQRPTVASSNVPPGKATPPIVVEEQPSSELTVVEPQPDSMKRPDSQPITQPEPDRPSTQPHKDDEVRERASQLRAPRTVLSAVTAPRTGRLKSLLATLQPQQYELVTWPEEDHLIIQGHPGTGKTVIGMHRAAFLTDSERFPDGHRVPSGDVLILGPTSAFVDHVKPLLSDIAHPGWVAWSLAHFYAQLGDYVDPNLQTDLDRIASSADPLGTTITRAREAYSGPPSVRDFTQFLFAPSDEMRRAAGEDQEVLTFLLGGKNHEFARQHSRFHPTLAMAGLTISDVSLANRFRHIIVDEAQDLRPIDLKMLGMLVSHGVTLTLLGDMNQRRSDFTHDSWAEVAADLGLTRPGEPAPLIEIETGFRSTNQILRFAGGLLGKQKRKATALRDGPTPTVVPCKGPSATSTVIDQAHQLATRVGGLTAIITMDPRSIQDQCRNKGWARGSDRYAMRKTPESPPVWILHPDLARGLEFDGVVVLEPADFPAAIGRHGVLYTSLTRATKELVVVHTKPLPRELRSK